MSLRRTLPPVLAILPALCSAAWSQTQYTGYGDPTAGEQEVLEIINRARANPTAEGTRLASNSPYPLPGGDITENAPNPPLAVVVRPPLAMNANLLATARAHTSTHIVHWTLKHLLGEHARQAGSLVAPGRLRFDFPHPSAVPLEVLEEAELEANRRLALDDAVRIYETTFDEAKAQGAIALFGEKYGDLVRVVEVGDYSRELCGGTHVHRTGNVSLIKILHEGSIGAGMRRVEALVGPDALREINTERALLRGLVDTLGSTDPASAIDRARQLLERVKRL